MFATSLEPAPPEADRFEHTRTTLARIGNRFRAGCVSAFWAVHVAADFLFEESGWVQASGPWHVYLAVSLVLLVMSHTSDGFARRSVLLVPLLDMPMVYWIQHLHAPLGDPPLGIVAFTSGGYVLLVLWSALGLSTCLTLLSSLLAGVLQARLFYEVGGSVSAMLASMVLLLSAGFLTVVTTRRLGSSIREALETGLRSEQAERAAREKDRFVATVSHDFRTPLTVILTTFQTLEAEPDMELGVRDDLIGRAIAQCRKISRMTQDLVRLARLGSIELDLEDVDLVRLIREIVEQMEPAAREHCAVVEEAPGNPSTLSGRVDAPLLERALLNLVDNALRYGARNVHLLASVHDSNNVRISVLDDGPGIHVEPKSQVFEPFNRGSGTGSGSGLGLAIVRQVAVAHGGEVFLDAGDTGGCQFTLLLPQTAAP